MSILSESFLYCVLCEFLVAEDLLQKKILGTRAKSRCFDVQGGSIFARVATQRSHPFGSPKNAPTFSLLAETFQDKNAPGTKTLPIQKRSRYKNAPDTQINASNTKTLPMQKRSKILYGNQP